MRAIPTSVILLAGAILVPCSGTLAQTCGPARDHGRGGRGLRVREPRAADRPRRGGRGGRVGPPIPQLHQPRVLAGARIARQFGRRILGDGRGSRAAGGMAGPHGIPLQGGRAHERRCRGKVARRLRASGLRGTRSLREGLARGEGRGDEARGSRCEPARRRGRRHAAGGGGHIQLRGAAAPTRGRPGRTSGVEGRHRSARRPPEAGAPDRARRRIARGRARRGARGTPPGGRP